MELYVTRSKILISKINQKFLMLFDIIYLIIESVKKIL